MKRRTEGIDPKIIGQAVATIIAFVLGFWAIDLPAETSTAIAVVVGLIAGFFSPAPATSLRATKNKLADERGYGLIELVVALFVILILVFILLRVIDDSDADAAATVLAHWKVL